MTLTRLWAIGLFGIAVSSPAYADGNWYGGISVGRAEANEIGFEDIDDGSALSGTVSNNDTGWKIFGGYSYNDFVSLEFSYVDLGAVSIDAVSDGNGVAYAPGPVTAAIETTGFAMSVVASMPVSEQFRLHAKVGYYLWEADQSLSNSAFEPVSVKLDGTDPTVGVGASYRFAERFSVRGEYEKFTDIDNVDGSLLSLGLTMSF